MHVVSANVPALLVLGAMDYSTINPCTVTNSLIKRDVQNRKHFLPMAGETYPGR